jgi:hypothetical protein
MTFILQVTKPKYDTNETNETSGWTTIKQLH